eukprot:GHVU01058429.1.p1 GENE.GHVU01058429.1~~GHVU01058429.1.p1  ORF type:complete len:140 (-),score=3.74 GHVU01058429.1:99-518(-)
MGSRPLPPPAAPSLRVPWSRMRVRGNIVRLSDEYSECPVGLAMPRTPWKHGAVEVREKERRQRKAPERARETTTGQRVSVSVTSGAPMTVVAPMKRTGTLWPCPLDKQAEASRYVSHTGDTTDSNSKPTLHSSFLMNEG